MWLCKYFADYSTSLDLFAIVDEEEYFLFLLKEDGGLRRAHGEGLQYGLGDAAETAASDVGEGGEDC